MIERNLYCRFGEIDLVAYDGEYLCFIEVKYRSGIDYGLPEEAVDQRKIKKISKCAFYYCYKNRLGTDRSIRFDVVSIEGEDIRLIKNAFEYCE